MGGEPLLSDVIHAAAADLDLHPLPVRSHHRQVQCLIPVRFRTAHPVTDPIWTNAVDIGNHRVDVPALVLLIHTR